MASGSLLEIDWSDEVPAILATWCPGTEGGRAIADVLCGDCNPCGKLPVTYANKLADCAARELHGFRKGWLEAGERRAVEFELSPAVLAWYRENTRSWRSDPGDYERSIGNPSRDLYLRARVRYG